MNRKESKLFNEYSYEFANRFLSCVCADTPNKYIKTFSKFRYWRLVEELEFKHNLKIDESNEKIYKKYEKIMVEVLSNRIEECKIERIEKEKALKNNKKLKTK